MIIFLLKCKHSIFFFHGNWPTSVLFTYICILFVREHAYVTTVVYADHINELRIQHFIKRENTKRAKAIGIAPRSPLFFLHFNINIIEHIYNINNLTYFLNSKYYLDTISYYYFSILTVFLLHNVYTSYHIRNITYLI